MAKLRLVLLGGGHAHAIVLRMWAMHPLPDCELILVSNGSEAPYSGMLPGTIAGLYSHDEMHIDLRRLAAAAGAQFILGEAEGIDREARTVRFAPDAEGIVRPPLYFDRLSLNVGSRPELEDVPGARRWAVPVKPVPDFLRSWESLIHAGGQPHIVLVGGGAGGVELALAMRARLKTGVTLIQGAPELLPQHTPRARRLLMQRLKGEGVTLKLGQSVQSVSERSVELEDGSRVDFDRLYWVTQPSPLPLLKLSGLPLDEKGFLVVDDALRSIGDEHIFAVGDCASLRFQKRPKSGVFAVRQGAPLFHNLTRSLQGLPLQKVSLQKHYLSLIGLGDRSALGVRASWAAQGRLLWWLKEKIDRRFMARFSQLSPRMKAEGAPMPSEDLARCLGCGAKVSAQVLSAALEKISSAYPEVLRAEGIEWGLSAREDVGLWTPKPGQKILQSLDYFPSLIDDPFLAGRLACLHAFNDIIAKGARAHSALLLAVLPDAAFKLQVDQLHQLLAGVATQLDLLGASLIGGHSAEGENLAIGVSATGLSEERLLLKKGGKVGDRLILTKAIGTGVIFAAAMQGRGKGIWVDAALQSMLQFSPGIYALLQDPSLHAATDVTGFGLIGHLLEMLAGGDLSAQLDAPAIPFLPGAWTLAEAGVRSSLYAGNSAFEASFARGTLPQAHWTLCGDPQTSGGFLLAVAPESEGSILNRLHALGLSDARTIGSLIERSGDAIHWR